MHFKGHKDSWCRETCDPSKFDELKNVRNIHEHLSWFYFFVLVLLLHVLVCLSLFLVYSLEWHWIKAGYCLNPLGLSRCGCAIFIVVCTCGHVIEQHVHDMEALYLLGFVGCMLYVYLLFYLVVHM